MERLTKGGEYYFINIAPYYKVCKTHDEHFPTDDERFEKGNYFYSSRAVHDCFDEIDEKYGEILKKLAAVADEKKAKYFKKTLDLVELGRKAMMAKKPNYKAIVTKLIAAADSRTKAVVAAEAKTKKIHATIEKMITNANKGE